jgi:type I restriction enzyme R subunit
MKEKEANARIKINKLLEMAGWRFFPDNRKKANICLELNVKISERDLNELGEDFEHSRSGFVDYLLLDERNNPLWFLSQAR